MTKIAFQMPTDPLKGHKYLQFRWWSRNKIIKRKDTEKKCKLSSRIHLRLEPFIKLRLLRPHFWCPFWKQDPSTRTFLNKILKTDWRKVRIWSFAQKIYLIFNLDRYTDVESKKFFRKSWRTNKNLKKAKFLHLIILSNFVRAIRICQQHPVLQALLKFL